MTDASQIAANIQGDVTQGDPNEMNINQELVDSVAERIKQLMPNIQAMAQFEQMLQQNPKLAEAIASICPELIMAFVNVAQEMQQNSTVQAAPNGQPMLMQQGGMSPSGGDDGANAPQVEPDQDEEMPPPAATTTGNAPPSLPSQASPLRKQFFTGR